MAWFSLPVDPKAGEWKHEILARAVYTVAISCVLGPAVCLVVMNLDIKRQGLLIAVALVTGPLLLFALPEAFLRRTWKMVVLIPAVGWMVLLALSLLPSRTSRTLTQRPCPSFSSVASWASSAGSPHAASWHLSSHFFGALSVLFLSRHSSSGTAIRPTGSPTRPW